jgi:hypothetical protein
MEKKKKKRTLNYNSMLVIDNMIDLHKRETNFSYVYLPPQQSGPGCCPPVYFLASP